MPSRNRQQRAQGGPMKSVMSQIVIGIIVTVVGTVVADALLQGGKGRKRFFEVVHYSGLPRGR
jgi:hypothetical protein